MEEDAEAIKVVYGDISSKTPTGICAPSGTGTYLCRHFGEHGIVGDGGGA